MDWEILVLEAISKGFLHEQGVGNVKKSAARRFPDPNRLFVDIQQYKNRREAAKIFGVQKSYKQSKVKKSTVTDL